MKKTTKRLTICRETLRTLERSRLEAAGQAVGVTVPLSQAPACFSPFCVLTYQPPCETY
jgi:hypothetical protein